MPPKQTELTIREKAAIIYNFITGEPWTECYKIASRGELAKIEKSAHLAVLASSWKKAYKVQAFIQEFETLQNDKQNKIINEAINQDRQQRGDSESNAGKGRKQSKNIDYSDPKNRRQLYNEVIANSGDDYKTKLDAAKVFEQIQKDDREAAKAQKQSRVYLPVACSECPLYLKARKRLQNNNFVARETDPGEGKTTII